jgi:hypothetical protein
VFYDTRDGLLFAVLVLLGGFVSLYFWQEKLARTQPVVAESQIHRLPSQSHIHHFVNRILPSNIPVYTEGAVSHPVLPEPRRIKDDEDNLLEGFVVMDSVIVIPKPRPSDVKKSLEKSLLSVNLK